MTMSMEAPEELLEEKYEFTAKTRCDGCGARAYTRVYNEDKTHEFLFCLHDFNRHLAYFAENGYYIDNQKDILEAEIAAYNKKDIIT